MAKKVVEEMVRCVNCKVGALIQWDNNPIIVACRNLPTKDVAGVPRKCQHFKGIKGKPEIRKMSHYR